MDGHQRWTQTDINVLRSGVSRSISAEAMAETLGRTVKDIEAMTLRLRLRTAAAIGGNFD
jgi:hypothetical protein